MPRNAEVIRQWKILLELDRKRHGLPLTSSRPMRAVGKRTIWRDMAALQEAGFPLTSEKRADSRTYWLLIREPMKSLQDVGLSLTEVCSLYMSRALLTAMPGAAFADGLSGLMKKIEKALTPRVRAYLDQLPGVIKVKPGALKKLTRNYDEIVARLIEASSSRRVAQMRYDSASSNREKDYEVHPYHVSYFDGGMYLTAFVPEYRQIRNFAVERIRSFVPTAATFAPPPEADGNPFTQSLGVNDGRPERVELEFSPRVARYVREREWHTTQQLRELSDGSVRLTLKVCRDWALRSWVLGFGAHARVIAPAVLAQEILAQLEEARDAYAPRLALEMTMAGYLPAPQPRLPMR
ncbi:MAG: WYL domain-containing transcriptional regulator [Vicinamibacterales bacterium]